MEFDEDVAQRLLSAYLTPDVVEQRRVIRQALALKPGDHVLDIGSGPGLLTSEMAAEVTPSGEVIGLEPSADMRALAAARASSNVSFVDGSATELPFEDARFDAITCTQVYEYVTDMPSALREARRVLRPGGRLLVLDTDWDSIVWHSSDDARMGRVLKAWDEHLADPYLPRRLPTLLRASGLAVSHAQVVPLLNIGYDAQTYSAGLIGFITAFVPGRSGVAADEVDAWAADLRGLGDTYFFSLNRYLFVAD